MFFFPMCIQENEIRFKAHGIFNGGNVMPIVGNHADVVSSPNRDFDPATRVLIYL